MKLPDLSLAAAIVLIAGVSPNAGAASEILGAPWRYHVIDSGLGADGARLLDVNGDGRLDIATGWEQGAVTRAYLNPGPALAVDRWPFVTVGTTDDAEDAVFADINGDGAYDIVSAAEGSTRALYVQFAPSSPAAYLTAAAWSQINLNGAVNAPVNNQYMFSVVTDLNGDGRPEIIAGGKNGSEIGYFTSASGSVLNPANWTYYKLRDVGWTMSLILHDFDRDGDLDLLLSDRRIWTDRTNGANTQDLRGVYWLENPGAVRLASQPGAPWTSHPVGVTGREVMLIALGDINGDGRQDIAAPIGNPAREVHLFFATDDSGSAYDEVTLNLEAKLGDGFGTGKALSITDVNQDGRQDLVFTAEKATGDRSGVVWLSYGDSPTNPEGWTVHQIAGVDGEKYDLAAILDVNSDGFPDVVTTEEHNNAEGGDGGLGLVWYENPGSAVRPPLDREVPRVLLGSGKRLIRTSLRNYVLSGRARDDVRVAYVEVKVGSDKYKRARGTSSWRFTTRLVPGRNPVIVRAVDTNGRVSRTEKLTLVRR